MEMVRNNSLLLQHLATMTSKAYRIQQQIFSHAILKAVFKRSLKKQQFFNPES